MKVFQKITKTELLILALTAAFLGTLALALDRQSAWAPGTDYTIHTQYQAEEPVTPAPEPPQLVNINTAGPEELETLDGIGPALAERIVAYREEHGPFRTVEELVQVRGIGEATLEKVRDSVTVGTAEETVERENS